LRNDPVTARATYKAVRSRFWGLVAASLIVVVWFCVAFFPTFMVWYLAVVFLVLATIFLSTTTFYVIPIVLGVIGGIVLTLLSLWFFFFVVGRVAYVPQVMLVEGKGVIASFSRSFSLARGNVRRLMAMTLFTSFAAYSALMILVVPLGWYGYVVGIIHSMTPIGPFGTQSPIAYSDRSARFC